MAGAGGVGLELSVAGRDRVVLIYTLLWMYSILRFSCVILIWSLRTAVVIVGCTEQLHLENARVRTRCLTASPTGKGSGRWVSTAVMSSTRRSRSHLCERHDTHSTRCV